MPTTDVTTWWLLLLMGVILLVCVVAPFLKDKMPPPPPEGNHPDCPGQMALRFNGNVCRPCPRRCVLGLGYYGNDGILSRAA